MTSFSLFNGRLDSIWEPNAFSDIPAMVETATEPTLKPLFTATNHGQETSVSDLLKGYASDDEKECPILLNPKFTFTDHAGRTFRNITLLQYAIFNLDTPMIELIKSFMHQDDVAAQMEAIRDGMTYDIPRATYHRLMEIAPGSNPPRIQVDEDSKEHSQDFVTLKEKHYEWGFRVFKTAMEKYIAAVTSDHCDHDLLAKLWSDVRFTQQFLPVIFINAYCSDISFAKIPDFNDAAVKAKLLVRTDSYYNLASDSEEFWFADACLEDVPRGIYKGKGAQWSMRRTPCEARADEVAPVSVPLDLAALSALYETLESDYNLAFEEARAYSLCV